MSEDRGRRVKREKPDAGAVLERVRQLKQQALQHQNYDVIGWETAVEDLRQLGLNDDSRAAFEEVLDLMPTAVSIWVRYIELELGPNGNMESAKVLFNRCLLTCPSVDLHMCYLRYIKRSNEETGPAGVAQLRAAYAFSLETVGQDMAAGPLWQEYINFLQQPKPGTAQFAALFPNALEGQEEAARTPLVRHAFQEAVIVPCNQLDALWRSYEQWETKLDKQLGRKILDEWRPRYQAARNALRERRRKRDPILMDGLPLPPGKGGHMQAEQVQHWKQYLDWEASNPQRLDPVTSDTLQRRITLSYQQCLTVLWYHPEVWLQHAHMQLMYGGTEKSLGVLLSAQTAIPGCSLLYFTAAELLEAEGRIELAQKVYDGLVDALDKEIPTDPEQRHDSPDNGALLSPFGGEQGVLIWLQYIRFLRRTADVGSARQMFLRARRWHQHSISLQQANAQDIAAGAVGKPTGGQLYAGMARMEWSYDHSSPAVPCRIFELGLEDSRLSRDPPFINAYSAFLCEIGDVDNARALYERMLSEPDAAAQSDIWRAYSALEQAHGNLAAARQVEDRMRKALAAASESSMKLPSTGEGPTHPAIAILATAVTRYSCEGITPCNAAQAPHLRFAAGLGPPPQPDEFEPKETANGYVRGDKGYRDREFDREGSYDLQQDRAGRDMSEPPDLLDFLINQLPPPNAVEVHPLLIDAVIDVLTYVDMSPPTVSHICAELDVGNLPPGVETGVVVPQLLEISRANAERDDGYAQALPYDHYERGPPPPPHHDPYMHYEHPPPHFPPVHERPGPVPMTRKRRWEGPEGRGPPPPYRDDYDGPPPPYDEHYEPPPAHWYEDRGRDRDRRPQPRGRMDG